MEIKDKETAELIYDALDDFCDGIYEDAEAIGGIENADRIVNLTDKIQKELKEEFGLP